MKLRNIGLLVTASALTFGCAKFNLDKIKYKVVPSPLEYKADSIEVTITAEYPKKTMPKKATAEVTPVLKYKGGEKAFKTLPVKGEKATGSGTTLSWSGGTVKYNAKIPYVDGMQEAELHVKGVGYMKGKEKANIMTTEPIALGTIITPLLLKKDEKFVYGKHNYGPITLTKKVSMYFPYNAFNIRPSEKDSASKGTFNSFVDFQIKDGGTFKSMEVNGWASPDGEEGKNNELSTKRADEVKKYLEGYIKDKKLTLTVTSKGNGEDLNGLTNVAKGKSFEGLNDLINKVKSGAKNSELKSAGNASFNQFEKEVLSPLRKAEVTLTVTERQKTNAELIDLAKNNPKKLTLEELLYTAETLITDDATKISVLQSTASQFPTDYRANNNIGIIYAKQGKLNEALTEFQKAEKLAGSDKGIKNNIGAVYMLKGDKANAITYYKQGTGSQENNHNMGNVYITQGKYSEAVSAYGSENSFNAALAKILAGNPEKAPAIIDGSSEKEDALSYYLKAVAAARTNSNQAVFDNLKTAIQKDGSLKAKAKADLEFLKLRSDSNFTSITN
jgi:Flp pilus assembly protein TadD/outer membrane protein OmpA-like peptidoglycan-associated protein